MKICFLAPANNYHTKKWCKWFANNGYNVHVISFIDDVIENTTVHYIDSGVNPESSDFKKLKYLLCARTVRKVIEELKPDIINAHYATSYGAVAALSGIKDYVLSVWGADIYDFPQKSFAHKIMLKYSIFKATYLFSTSNAMAKEASNYTKKKFEITPFGVDMRLFNPDKRNYNFIKSKKFVVGTVKSLTEKYGIGYLIKAVALIKQEHPEIEIELRIAGKGEKEKEYRELAYKLGISENVVWLGFISQIEAAKEWANMDVGIVYSTLESESFGVSAVECQACECPIVISDIPGLMEATLPGISSVVVPRCNERLLADAIIDLYNNSQLRHKMGIQGREFVIKNYEIDMCFKRIESFFNSYCQ